MLRLPGLMAFFAICLFSLTGCSTALVNANTLDLASTVSDTNTQQVIFNLVKTFENKWHLPAQVQLNNAAINAKTGVTPSFSNPVGATVTAIAAIAKSTATTTTDTLQRANPNQTASLSGNIEGTANWNVSPIQEPEALKRLQLLYQYGAGHIKAIDLTCAYPIPRRPLTEKKSDLEILADALASANAKRAAQDPDKRPKVPANTNRGAQKPGTPPQASANADHGSQKPGTPPKDPPKDVYLVGDLDFCENLALSFANTYAKHVGDRYVGGQYTAAAQNKPDLAFLTPPTCVLCAYPNNKFHKIVTEQIVTHKHKIYIDAISDTELGVKAKDVGKYRFIPIFLNDALAPNKRLVNDKTEIDYRSKIDWLFVSKDGMDGVPAAKRAEARLVGSAAGYSVYTTSEEKFSEFVIAVREAILQNPQVAKAGVPSPGLAQTVTGQ
jgi:hypothetical protein